MFILMVFPLIVFGFAPSNNSIATRKALINQWMLQRNSKPNSFKVDQRVTGIHLSQRIVRNVLRTSTSNLSSANEAIATEQSTTNEEGYDLSLLSPCKINLFLRIIRKREDGYHDLASLFQTIGFGDTIHFQMLDDALEEPPEDLFECNMEGVPLDKTNLVLRAVDLMRKKTGNTKKRFKVNLVKQVPAQAGLGGGSANAATAMFAVNELLGRPATQEQLVEWSAELGSDITFFFSLGTAYCTGRGEIMDSVDPPLKEGTKLTIVKPDIGLSTPEVFRALEYNKLSKEDPKSLLDRFLKEGVVDIGDDAYINDLEFPAFKVVPELKQLKDELKTVPGFSHVCMSGSGTSIFCIGEPSNKAAFDTDFGQRSELKVFHTKFITRDNEQTWWA